MNEIPDRSKLAVALVKMIKEGKVDQLQQLLADDDDFATCRIRGEDAGRTLLHIATDWPGHFPNVAETIRLLVEAGADVDAGINGPNTETPLHWAASSNDIAAVEALLQAGADLNAQGAVIAGGDPLEDAIGFHNWDAARCLVEHGATTKLGDEAALGLIDRIKPRFESGSPPKQPSIDYSFWNACCGGQLETAQYLLAKGANPNWVPDWTDMTSMDGAKKTKHEKLINWLQSVTKAT